MSTAARAARGGKKVQSSPSPQLTASSAPILTEGPVDLSSFLSGTAAATTTSTVTGKTNNNNTTGSAPTLPSATTTTTSVVRGRARDNQSSVKERDPGSKQSEVEAKLRSSFATLVNKSEQQQQEQQQKTSRSDDDAAVEKVQANAVTLIAESHACSTAISILKKNESSRVLIVSSLEDVIAATSTPSSSEFKIGSFYGTEKNIPSSVSSIGDIRLCYTTFRSAISFLNVFYRDSALVSPFTHVILVAKEGKCTPLFDATLSVLSTLVFSATVGVSAEEAQKMMNKNNNNRKHNNNNNNNKNNNNNIPQPKSGNKSLRNKAPLIKKAFGENVKIILAGVNSIEEIKNSISAPDKSFTLAAESLTQNEGKHAPAIFSSAEAAALAGTMVKEHSPSSVSLRRLPGSISSLPQSLIDHGVKVATSVLVKAVQAASSEKLVGGLRCAVIGAELSELQTAISGALPADSFKIYTDAKEFCSASSSSSSASILLLPRALGSATASQLRLHLVVDSGTERRAQIPPQSEMQFPIKAVLAPTRREAQARRAMAGWCDEGPGLFIAAADFTGSSSNKQQQRPPQPKQENNNDNDQEQQQQQQQKDESATTPSSTDVLPTRGVDNQTVDTSSANNNNNNNHQEQQQQQQNNEVDGDEEDLLEPVCDAVLALAQNGLDLSHLVRDARKGREAQLSLALPFLMDLGFISQGAYADLVVTTFLGEICARSGLPADFACIVINGLACGMADAAVFVATAAARPFRAAVVASAAGGKTTTTTGGHENEFGDTIEDAITLAEGVAESDNIKKYLESRSQTAYPIHQEAFEAAVRVAKIVQRGIEDFVIPSTTMVSSSSSSSAASIRKQITDNVNLLVAFIASALARRAVVIRHEGDDRINTVSRGNLLFTHTAKEVVPNRFVHTGASWKKDMVVICSSIQNTPTRLLGSGCTGVSNDYFMGCLFALSPFVSYEQVASSSSSTNNNNNNNNTDNSEGNDGNNNNSQNTLVSVSLNRLEKTSLLSQQLSEQLIRLRNQWSTLMSYVQLRRATGAKSASQFKELAAKHLDKRFNLENAQAEYITELCELISDFHVNVPLGSSNIGRDMSRVRSHVLCAPAPPSSLTSIAVPSDYAVAREFATLGGQQQDQQQPDESSSSNATATATSNNNNKNESSMGTKEESSGVKIGDVQNPVYEDSEGDDEGEEADVIIDDE